MTEIYYIEDDPFIARMVKAYLEERSCHVTVFTETAVLKEALVQRLPQLVLLDWNLPDGQGDVLCKELRSCHRELPMIFLTVKNDASDMISGLQNGADDYVTKPFELEVLYARIRALLRRACVSNLLSCGAIRLDEERMRVFSDGEEVLLSQMEYQLLRKLLKNKGRTVTRESLLAQIWDQNGNFVNDNTLTVTMKRLREKLGRPSCLKTVRSFGYRMEDR